MCSLTRPVATWLLIFTVAIFSGILDGTLAAHAESRLINGKEVDPAAYKEVIKIESNGSGCTATVVGPRVIITAAHCAVNGANTNFTIDGNSYSARMTQSPLYGTKDHDVAVGITANDIKVTPAIIGGKAQEGTDLTLLGYGCTSVGGGGGTDGKLRAGNTTIVGFSDFDMVSRKAGGAALCFGDSGGPSFVNRDGKRTLLGINSKGNIKDTNYNLRLDLKESKDFLNEFATTNSVVICGIRGNCSGDIDPPPAPPTCTLSADPAVIKLGETLTLNLVVTGIASEASIEGKSITMPAATASVPLTPSAKGNFTAQAMVKNSTGSNSCSTAYVVQENISPNPPPSCTLTATPQSLKVGEIVTLELTTTGKADKAQIDGVDVGMPVGKRMIKTTKGTFNVTGTVTGPGGNGSCWASYTASDVDPFPPETPNLAVIPSFCGKNTLPQSRVKQVCLAVVKRDASLANLRITETLLITYNDGARETLPIINRKPRKKSEFDARSQEDLLLYANTQVNAGNFSVLDSRTALLTKLPSRAGAAPTAIEGRSGKGWYFIVDRLSAFAE